METQVSCPSLGPSPRPAALSTAPEHGTVSLLDQPRFSQPRGAWGQVETVKKPRVKSFFTRSFVFFSNHGAAFTKPKGTELPGYCAQVPFRTPPTQAQESRLSLSPSAQ